VLPHSFALFCLEQLSCLAVGLSSRDAMLLQAKAWLSWEHSVSSTRTSSLQVWNGSQWQQTDFPNPGSKRLPLPLAAASQTGGSSGAPASTEASQSAGGSSSGAGDATQQAQPAPMSAFTAQALLECHYSHNHAFLQSPLLQVGKASLMFTLCQCFMKAWMVCLHVHVHVPPITCHLSLVRSGVWHAGC